MSVRIDVRRPEGPDGPRLSAGDVRTFTAIRRLVESDNEVWIAVTGVSMRPTLLPGDRVLLVRSERGRLAGRIVLADVRGHPVLHRVVREMSGTLVTAGDNCHRVDPPIPRAAVVARAEAVYSTKGVTALGPTMRFGLAALARYWLIEARALWAKVRRRAHSRWRMSTWMWSR